MLNITQLSKIPGVKEITHYRAVSIHNLSELDNKENHHCSLGFASHSNYRNILRCSRLGAVIVSVELKNDVPDTSVGIISTHPRISYAHAAFKVYPYIFDTVSEQRELFIDSTAKIGAHVRLGTGVVLGKGVYIGDYSQIGDYSVIDDNCQIGSQARIGKFNHIQYSLIGNNFSCLDHNSLGGAGYAFDSTPEGIVPIAQLGLLQIGHDVRIISGCSIDRGALGNTIIKNHVQIESQCKIAHNVYIGEATAIVGQVAIAGSAHIGSKVQIAGKSGLKGSIHIGNGAKIMAHSAITKDVKAGSTMFGIPAMPLREFSTRQYYLSKLIKEIKK